MQREAVADCDERWKQRDNVLSSKAYTRERGRARLDIRASEFLPRVRHARLCRKPVPHVLSYESTFVEKLYSHENMSSLASSSLV